MDAITLAVPAGSAAPAQAAPAVSTEKTGAPSTFESTLAQAESGGAPEPDDGRFQGARAVRHAPRGCTRSAQTGTGAGARPTRAEPAQVGTETATASVTTGDGGTEAAAPEPKTPPEQPTEPLVVAPPVGGDTVVALPVESQPVPLPLPADLGLTAGTEAGSAAQDVPPAGGPDPTAGTDTDRVRPAAPGAIVRLAAHDRAEWSGPRALGVRTGVAAAENPAPLRESREAAAGLPAEAAPADAGQVRPDAAGGSEEVDLPSVPSPRAFAAFPAGRAYQRAARTADGDLSAGQKAAVSAAPSSDISVGPDIAQLLDTEPAPQPLTNPAPVSARAAAVLRSIGVPAAPPDAGASAGPAQAGASLSDLMTAVAIEFAAATAGESRRESFGEGGTRDRSGADPGRRTDTAGSFSSSPAPFAVPAPAPAPTSAAAAETVDVPGGARQAQAPPIADQVVKVVALAWRGGVGEARIRLTPEHLGDVVVSMSVERGQVRAQVYAETATARAWIETHQQDLRDGLLQQGLALDRLVVTSDGQRRQQQDDGAKRQQRPPNRVRTGEGAPRFELTV